MSTYLPAGVNAQHRWTHIHLVSLYILLKRIEIIFLLYSHAGNTNIPNIFYYFSISSSFIWWWGVLRIVVQICMVIIKYIHVIHLSLKKLSKQFIMKNVFSELYILLFSHCGPIFCCIPQGKVLEVSDFPFPWLQWYSAPHSSHYSFQTRDSQEANKLNLFLILYVEMYLSRCRIVKWFIFETIVLTFTWSDCQVSVRVNGQVGMTYGQAKIKIKTSI